MDALGLDNEPLLTVIIPVYNEVATIDTLLSRVVASSIRKQVIIVDDGSTDGTSEKLMAWKLSTDLEILSRDRNLGKGAAIRTALSRARGQFTLIQDADLEYSPTDYDQLLKPLFSGAADVVYGSRYKGKTMPWTVFRCAVVIINTVVLVLFGHRITDEATCYKVFKTSHLRLMKLECVGFEFCPEVTAKCFRLRLRLIELSIQYSPRGRREGKKISFRDAITAIKTLWKWRKWVP